MNLEDRLVLRISNQLKSELEAEANLMDYPVSDIVREAIREKLVRMKEERRRMMGWEVCGVAVNPHPSMYRRCI